MNKEKSKTHRWIYLISGIVSMLVAGVIYAWSILKAPLADEFGWSAPVLALNFTLTMCFFCIGGVISGILTRKTSPKLPVIVGAILAGTGFCITSRMSGLSATTLYLAYGVLSGLGIGMAYNAVISATNAWFPDQKGTCSGALMLSFGASALVLGKIANRTIESQSIGWRTTFMGLGVILALVMIVEGLIVRFPPDEMELPTKIEGAKTGEDLEAKEYSTAAMIRRASFWIFFLFSITLSAAGNTVISFARDFSVSVGATASFAATLVGILSICNGLGRILSGTLFDRKGRQFTTFFASALEIVAVAVDLAAVLSCSLWVGVLGLCLTGLSYGTSPTITASFIGAFYGSKNFPLNFSIANMMLIPTSFVATIAGCLVTRTGGYTAPFVMLLIFSVLSMVLNLSIKRP